VIVAGVDIAAGCLAERDGMDLQLATDIIMGMDQQEIDALIEEHNNRTIAKTEAKKAATLVEEPKEEEADEPAYGARGLGPGARAAR
jgi:hypothetical protein